MPESSLSRLADRAVIRVGGAQRQTFLDGLLTCAIADLSPGGLAYGALLTPQGKIIADMMVFADEDTLALDVPESARDDLVRRLTLYKLRAAVTLEASEEAVAVTLAAVPGARPDPRGPGLGYRLLLPADEAPPAHETVLADYAAARIAAGVPDAVVDFPLGDTFPHDANMDLTHGVDFRKGCFVGQEVVSRMRHRGTARRRTVIAASHGGEPLPPSGTALIAGGKPVGHLGTVAGESGLAMVRIDRIGADGSAEADGLQIDLSVPAGAPFALAGAR